MTAKKIRVGILFGGRSGEHEISLRSAFSIFRELDKSRFEPILISIDKEGIWRRQEHASSAVAAGEILAIDFQAPECFLVPYPTQDSNGAPIAKLFNRKTGDTETLDIVFPVLHGPNGEDGTIQGLLDLAEAPYVGGGIFTQAAGMDKEASKRLVQNLGVPVTPYLVIRRTPDWKSKVPTWMAKAAAELGFPMFIKPAKMGSSVGVHKVKDVATFGGALEDAFLYDTKVLIEKGIDCREIEVAVLEAPEGPCQPPRVSLPGEVIPNHEFYSYEAKYIDADGAKIEIPAHLSPEQVEKIRTIAGKAFESFEGEGMARVDLFLEKTTGKIYFNEINTIPGFTSISMYPMMWKASGLTYPALLSELIRLGIQRAHEKASLKKGINVEQLIGRK